MRIDRQRLERAIEELGAIGATARGGLTRLALSDKDKRGRDWKVARMREDRKSTRLNSSHSRASRMPSSA